MLTRVKTPAEQRAMRTSGRMLGAVLAAVKDYAAAGMTTKDIDVFARRELKSLGGKPAFLGYEGFPGAICTSVNDVVVHGIPSKRVLQSGDILSCDFGVNYQGMITDSAFSMVVGGEPTAKQRALLDATEASLRAGIAAAHGGGRVGDIGAAVQAVLQPAKLGIVRDLVGHGVGHDVHEEPNIPNYGAAGVGFRFEAGMTIAIEPMATLGSHQVTIDANDGWTVRTKDGSLSAHFEHTVLLTDAGAEIITVWPSDTPAA